MHEIEPAYGAALLLQPLGSGTISDRELDEVAAGICGMQTCAMDACGVAGNYSK